MLRITVQENGSSIVLMLEGKLAGDWVGELRRVWENLQVSCDGKRLAVILTDVSTVDVSGQYLLAEIHAAGADLQGSGIATAALIRSVMKHPR